MNDKLTAIQEAVHKAGGQAALAKLLGCSGTLVWKWLNEQKGHVTAEHAISIEEATGIPRERLRPDLNWDRGEREEL